MYNKLIQQLKKYQSVALGFSGGVDSSLLAVALRDSGIKYIGVTVQSALLTEAEIAQSVSFCQQFGIRQQVVTLNILSDPEIAHNPPERCYYCKKKVFTEIQRVADAEGLTTVIDGSQMDDIKVYRPGRKALEQLGVVSPFVELGWSKQEIRKVSAMLELPTAWRESATCLATRIPYGDTLTKERLIMVAQSEAVLQQAGLTRFRCRVHGELLRVEAEDVERAVPIVQQMLPRLKEIGFRFVTVDMSGYQMGCYDE